MQKVWRRILWWWRRDREEREIDEELRAHMVIETGQRLEHGDNPDEVEFAARRAFGNPARIAEETRDVWRPVWLDQLRQDMRYAFVTLTRNPGYAIGAIVSLGFGIGAATAVFSAVEGLVLNPFPYSGADRIVVLSQAQGTGPSRRTFLTSDQARLLTEARSVDAVILWDESWMWTNNEGIPEMVYGGRLSRNVFQLLGCATTRGAYIRKRLVDIDKRFGRSRGPELPLLANALWGGDQCDRSYRAGEWPTAHNHRRHARAVQIP